MKLIATDLVESRMIFLRDKNHPVITGQVLNITTKREEYNSNITNQNGEPFCMVHFGFEECCENCRNGLLHHSLPKSQFETTFFCSDSKEATPPIGLITAPHSPILAKKIIDKMRTILRIAGRKSDYSDNEIAVGRFKYTLRKVYRTAADRDNLTIDVLDCMNGAKVGQKFYTYGEAAEIPFEKAESFLGYYKAIETAIERTNKLTEEIMALHDKIIGGATVDAQ